MSILPTSPGFNTPLPTAYIGAAYSQAITQTGVTGTVTWSISAGVLPNGLTISPTTGIISGTPTVSSAPSSITVQVTNGYCSGTKNYSIGVSCPSIYMTNTTSTNSTINTPYTLNASAIGNTAPLTYSVSPVLPTGLSLNTTTGLISGTPMAITALATYTVTATQSVGNCFGLQTFTFAVGCDGISITNTLPSVYSGATYNQILTQTGLSGTLVWSISWGILPIGLTLSPTTGILSGIPTTAMSYDFTVQVSNGTCFQTKTYTIVITSCNAVSISASVVSGAFTCTTYTQTFTQTGLTGTPTWSVSGGTLPVGTTLSPTTGILSGMPASGTFNFTISVTDGNCIQSKAHSITIQGANLNLTWANNIQTGLGDYNNFTVDNVGNIYHIGAFKGTADFDPGTGVFNMTTNVHYGTYDEEIFVSKLDPLGNFLWAKRMVSLNTANTNPLRSRGNSIKVDNVGNIYITGKFEGIVDFDPGVGIFNLTSTPSSNGSVYDNNVFISKLDASGNFIWAKQMGADLSTSPTQYGYINAHSLVLDALGNVYTTGYFRNTIDFDPGIGNFNLTGGGTFISKLDMNGNFILAKKIGGVGFSIALDSSGNIYTTGLFGGTADFDPNLGIVNMVSAGNDDVFISKLDNGGNFVWAKRMGSYGSDVGSAITVDASGNIYTTGSFQYTGDFDPGVSVLNLISAGNTDVFISKLDMNGNFVWAKSMGGTTWDSSSGITVDVTGNVYTVGEFTDIVDFNPNSGVFNLNSLGDTDGFISKLDMNGNFVWAKSIGGYVFLSGQTDAVRNIALDAFNNIYVIGRNTSPADFDPNIAVFTLPQQGHFIAKYSQVPCTGITIDTPSLPNITVGNAYSQALTQTGLTCTLMWTIRDGTLPNGLNIANATGRYGHCYFVNFYM